MTIKAELRSALRLRRDAFVATLDDAAAYARAAAGRLEALATTARCIAGYVALGSEFPVLAMLERANALGIATALPRVDRRGDPLRFLAWQPGDPLETGYFGLSQPIDAPAVDPDLILTPLLAFDRAFGRLGQGAGLYDLYFHAQPAARRIGTAWSVQEVDNLPLDAWDMPLHAVITEKEWIGPPP